MIRRPTGKKSDALPTCLDGGRNMLATSCNIARNMYNMSGEEGEGPCWRKIRTLRQAHSKSNKAGLTREQIPGRASQFSWN
jgi:hypothetical protein